MAASCMGGDDSLSRLLTISARVEQDLHNKSDLFSVFYSDMLRDGYRRSKSWEII